MLRNGRDELVQKSFRELRDREAAAAPPFGRVWQTARAAAGTGRAPVDRLTLAFGAVAVAALASTVTLVATRPETPVRTAPVASQPAASPEPRALEPVRTTADEPETPIEEAEAPRPATVSNTSPTRRTSKPVRTRRPKSNPPIPCVAC